MNLDLYQARNGKIYLRNGQYATPLTKDQIHALHIVVFELEDFDFDDYQAAYSSEITV